MRSVKRGKLVLKLVQSVCKLVVVTILCLAFVGPPSTQVMQTAYAASPDAPKKVLIFPSYNFDYLGIQWFNKGLMAELGEKYPHKVSYSIENLQLATHPEDEAYFSAMAESLRIKYTKDKPDIIVAQYKQSFDFLRRFGHEIFGDVPVVFAGLELEGHAGLKIPAHFTGIITSFNAKRSIDLILQLHPQTRTLYVINGVGTVEKDTLANALIEAKQYQDRLQVIVLSQLPFEQILSRVAEIRGNSAILYLSMQIDAEGRVHVPALVAREIGSVAQVPVYGMLDTFVGSGITGGFLIDHEKLGRRAADIAKSILQGQPPTGNLVTEAIGENTFDWRQLKRWGIDTKSLPAGSIVEFKEFSLWEIYKWHLIGIICFIFLQSLLVFILLVNRSRLRRVENVLRETNENLEIKVEERTQDLQGANEELIAQNEEMQSLNEENEALNQNLKELNEVLEQRVSERTTDLMAAHQELSAQYDNLQQSKEAQRLSNILLEQTFEQSPVPMVLVSMPGAIFRFVNPACRKFLRINEGESLLGSPLMDLNPEWKDCDGNEKITPLSDSPLARSLMGIENKGEERRIVHRDGTVSYELVSSSPILDDKGKVIAGYLVMMDVTERMRRMQEIQHDAQLATRVQNALLSVIEPSDYLDIATIYQPLGYVGGDLYFLDWRYDGSLLRGFLVDATGHGLGTALHTASLHVLLREINERDLPLADAMRWLNRRTWQYFDEGTFASALGFEIDLQTRQLRWVCAGIPKMWLCTKMQKGLVVCPGMPLGIQPDEMFDLHTISIDVGDSFYFMTDGVADMLEGSIELPLERWAKMVETLGSIAKSENRRDDATVVCVHVKSLPQTMIRQDGWPRTLRFNGYGDYQRFKEEVRKILSELTGLPHSLHEVAVQEALANAMESRDGVSRQHKARLRVNKIGSLLIVRVKTSRIGFAGNAILKRLRAHPEDMFSFGEDSAMGRGIPMMLSISHKMMYNSEGTEVLLAWKLNRA